MSPRALLPALLVLALAGCVTGNQIRAESEVIQNDIERAKRSGAKRCAPRELAKATAELDFARGELMQGNSFRARDHINAAELAIKKALELSKDCGPKQILVREKEDEKKPPPVVVRIEETDGDGDRVVDKDDACVDRAEDRDGFQDEDGCPDPDNDADEVLDTNDKCPVVPGPLSNQGCPVETPKDTDEDGVVDAMDKCPNTVEDKDGFKDEDGCPEPDNDDDGLLDSADKCPNDKGPIQNLGCPVLDKDGDGILDDQDRCPDEAGPQSTQGCAIKDRDGDGVADDADRCPNDAEDKDGFKDDDGCVDADNDSDGQPDSIDRCPDQPGPVVTQGCPVKDRDGDGIDDEQDKCPAEGEDKDGFQDRDGCPDYDNDGDGVEDDQDKCPDEAGPRANGGCSVKDRDADGIPDDQDKCPDQAGKSAQGGCPVLDADADGIPDAQDKCPDRAGAVEAFGCPDADKDEDGIVDRLDKCPEEFGIQEEGGCPKKYKMVVVKKDRIQIKQQIKFAPSSAKILDRQSFQIIAEVAQALKDNPQIKKLRVEGHTDSLGTDAVNLRLSQKRAESVMSALIQAGVDPERLTAVGFGETQPIASNATKAGRAENRRTEFNIVEQ